MPLTVELKARFSRIADIRPNAPLQLPTRLVFRDAPLFQASIGRRQTMPPLETDASEGWPRPTGQPETSAEHSSSYGEWAAPGRAGTCFGLKNHKSNRKLLLSEPALDGRTYLECRTGILCQRLSPFRYGVAEPPFYNPSSTIRIKSKKNIIKNIGNCYESPKNMKLQSGDRCIDNMIRGGGNASNAEESRLTE